MTNLDRLKGSGLLMDGFEEFLAKQWLSGALPNTAAMSWPRESQQVFDQMPYVLRRFYEIDHRWPQAHLRTKLGSAFYACGSPRYATSNTYQAVSDDGRAPLRRQFVKQRGYATVVRIPFENQEIAVRLGAADEGELFFNDYRTSPCDWPAVGVPLDEFLVALAFRGLAIHGVIKEPDRSKDLIFTGRFHQPDVMEVFTDGETLALFDENGDYRMCRPPEPQGVTSMDLVQ